MLRRSTRPQTSAAAGRARETFTDTSFAESLVNFLPRLLDGSLWIDGIFYILDRIIHLFPCFLSRPLLPAG